MSLTNALANRPMPPSRKDTIKHMQNAFSTAATEAIERRHATAIIDDAVVHAHKVSLGWCDANGRELSWRDHQREAKWAVQQGDRIVYVPTWQAHRSI